MDTTESLNFYKSIYPNSIEILNKSKDRLNNLVELNHLDNTINSILSERTSNGLSLEDISLLLTCLFDPKYKKFISENIIKYSKLLRQKLFNNQLATMVPIEVSSFCASNCEFCGWKSSNKDMVRLRINEQAFFEQLEYLIDLGFKHIEIAAGDDIDFIKNHLSELVKIIKFKYSDIRVSICLTPLSKDKYSNLKTSGLDTVLTWQETYDKSLYNKLILSGPKSKGLDENLNLINNGDGYLDRVSSQERAVNAGLQVGLGTMIGLHESPETDILSLIIHGKYLLSKYKTTIKPLIIGMPTWNHITTKNYDRKNSESVDNNLIEDLFPVIAGLYLLAFDDHKAWIFANCRVSMNTQLNAIESASVFTSTMVLLGPGSYLKKINPSDNYDKYFLKTSKKNKLIDDFDLKLGEQFKHFFYDHEEYVAAFKKNGYYLCSDTELLRNDLMEN